MSSTIDHNEISKNVPNSSSIEVKNEQDHHPKVASFIDHNITNNHGPIIMNQRIKRPLSTYTCLGSPIHRSTILSTAAVPRKMSIGYDHTPTTPQHNTTMQSRSRSNSHSAVVTGLPDLFLPMQQSVFDNLVPLPSSAEDKMYGASENYNSVIEATHASENKRTVELEREEANMSADEIRYVLKLERERSAKIQADLQVALLRYNQLLSSQNQQQQQQHSYNRLQGELSDPDRMVRRKRKLEADESSKIN